jgi:hypothetical protein
VIYEEDRNAVAARLAAVLEEPLPAEQPDVFIPVPEV